MNLIIFVENWSDKISEASGIIFILCTFKGTFFFVFTRFTACVLISIPLHYLFHVAINIFSLNFFFR